MPIMIQNVENQGRCRRGYSLVRTPPRLYAAISRGHGESVPVFEPYEENLPLEAGRYAFVIDGDGQFHVKRGNFSSHSWMVNGSDVGAAGQFRVNRAGNVAEVFCRSSSYRIFIHDLITVRFVLGAFAEHHALEVSRSAVFRFWKTKSEPLVCDVDENLVQDATPYLLASEAEGQGPDLGLPFRPDQVRRLRDYRPEVPPRLHEIQLDQLINAIEGDDDDSFEYGDPMPPLDSSASPLSPGKKAFVVDDGGRLIVGHGHQILSGGRPVGGAGQVVVDATGRVCEINLNFSGHHRPPLDARYVRYIYRLVRGHPLLDFADECTVSGRKFEPMGGLSTVLRFDEADLLSDGEGLDFLIDLSDF